MNEKYSEVLSHYDLHVASVRRGRGSWICETEEGLKLLKEYKGTVKRLEFEDQVLEQVQKQSRLSVDRYVRSQDGELISPSDDGTRFVVKDWFSDRECDLKNQHEIMEAVSKVARLHGLLRDVGFKEEWNLGSILARPLQHEMERHNRELHRARNYIRDKRRKSEFELRVIGNFQMFYDQALEATAGLKKLMETEKPSLFLCHGDLDQHHILMGAGSVAFIDFNKMHLGMQMDDLYHFVRKVLEKHNWNLELGLSMLKSYDRVSPMTDVDRECLYYLFLYPEKYWKQINFYFNANKAWIPDRNVEKLRNLEEQQGSRDRFLSRIK